MSTGARPSAPRGTPAAARVAVLVALALVGIGVVAVRDLLVTQDWVAGSAWVPSLAASLDGVTASTGLAVAGGVLGAVGVLLVLLVLRRGRRTHVAVTTSHEAIPTGSDLWLTPGAVASLAHELADRSAGVVSTQVARSGRRRVVIDVESHPESAQSLETARQTVDAELGALTTVRLVVRPTKTSKVTS